MLTNKSDQLFCFGFATVMLPTKAALFTATLVTSQLADALKVI